MVDKQYYVDIINGLANKTIKRLWIIIILLVVLLVGTNVAWLYHENSFADEVITQDVLQEVETKDGNAFVNGIGDVVYGEGSTENTDYGQEESP